MLALPARNQPRAGNPRQLASEAPALIRAPPYRLADYRVNLSYPHRLRTENEVQLLPARLSRVAHALARPVTALPLLDQNNRLVIEAHRQSDGAWSIREPAAAA